MNVFSNLAISLDGRIADGEKPAAPLGTPYDRKRMQVIRARCDVLVVGANTLRAHPHTMRLKKKPKGRSQPANAVVTASGRLDPAWEFWNDPEVIRFVFTTDKGLETARAAAGDRAFVVSCGETRVSIERLLKRLQESDYKNVLVEGGGILVGQFLQENLLQELYVTHTPWILGSVNTPGLVENSEKLPWVRLKPLKIQRVKDEIYGHYRVKGARRV